LVILTYYSPRKIHLKAGNGKFSKQSLSNIP
jgi:hypothetical protein